MKIAIVNDVVMAAEGLRRVVADMPCHRLTWIAQNGAEAVDKCKEDTPDLILMDLLMPVMDGVEATRRIMASTPCAILIVTATIDGNSDKVFEALGAGALDVVQTPLLSRTGPSSSVAALKFKIETLSRSREGGTAPTNSTVQSLRPVSTAANDRLVAIGASAGGPGALATVLGGLPSDFNASIVIVQHIDPQFVASLVAWLNDYSKVPVRIAQEGEPLRPGEALIAETKDHLVMLGPLILGYVAEPREYTFRPSVDVLFESVFRHWRGEVAGVLLSGMGRDGAIGLRSLRESGALTIAQDSATCAVYGMPKAAAELKAAVKILPVQEIASELVTFLAVRNSGVLKQVTR